MESKTVETELPKDPSEWDDETRAIIIALGKIWEEIGTKQRVKGDDRIFQVKRKKKRINYFRRSAIRAQIKMEISNDTLKLILNQLVRSGYLQRCLGRDYGYGRERVFRLSDPPRFIALAEGFKAIRKITPDVLNKVLKPSLDDIKIVKDALTQRKGYIIELATAALYNVRYELEQDALIKIPDSRDYLRNIISLLVEAWMRGKISKTILRGSEVNLNTIVYASLFLTLRYTPDLASILSLQIFEPIQEQLSEMKNKYPNILTSMEKYFNLRDNNVNA